MNCFRCSRRPLLACLASLVWLVCLSVMVVQAANPIRLTHDGRMKFTPVFVDGGESLTYVDFENPKVFRLRTLNSIQPTRPMEITFLSCERQVVCR